MNADVQTIGEGPGLAAGPSPRRAEIGWGRGNDGADAPGSRGRSPSQSNLTVSGFDLAAFLKAAKVTLDEGWLKAIPLPDDLNLFLGSERGRAELIAILKHREELIRAAKEDPLNYGWKPWYWQRASALSKAGEVLGMGGNRSGKTEWASNDSVADLVEKPNRIWAFCHSSADSSKRLQQPRIYSYLPPEWRNLGKQGKKVYVSYTMKNGFADGVFILPNGSQGYFFNYMQDVRVLEGYEFDGAWMDELAPVDWIEAMRYRLVTRKGRLILTFTPVEGYTPAVGKYVAGAKVAESRPSPLLPERINVKDCPKGEMPFVLACPNGGAHVVFFFTEWNPFNPYEEMVKKLEGAQVRDVMMRAYGWVEKAGGVAFPKFGSVHVVKRAGPSPQASPRGEGEAGLKLESPHVDSYKASMGALVPPKPWENLYKGRLPWRGTNYRVADPAPLKNWVIKWYRCDEFGRVFCYREWPDWAGHGAWAIAGKKADGDEGPAQRADFGKGIRDYKRIILRAEGWIWKEGLTTDGAEGAESGEGMWIPGPDGVETIMGSVMDPRGGGAAVPSDEKATSILQLLNEAQVDERGNIVGPPLLFREARGLKVGEGLDQFREWLTYDEHRPVDALNCPKFYVVEDCEQSIYALREYTGMDGEKGNLKDVIDPDRYFRTTPGLCFVGENDLGSFGGGGY